VMGIISQDAQAIVQSYADAGMLAPDADLRAVEDLTNVMLERFAGTFLGQMQDVNPADYVAFLAEYQDLLYDSPFVLQIDLLYVFRALGMLSGMIFNLYPQLNPMARARPVATKLAQAQLIPSKESALKTLTDLVKLPSTLTDVLNLVLRNGAGSEMAPASMRKIDSIERAIKRLTWVLGGVGLVVAGTAWESAGLDGRTLPFLGFALSAIGVVAAIAGCVRRG
jgi:predicted unusual protein kinase regulating ubiquinone biosynthesis (AarF/ABC1/UbiB family)